MAKYKENNIVYEVGNPELNPQLTEGRTLVPDNTPLGAITGSDLTPTTPIDYVNPNANYYTMPTTPAPTETTPTEPTPKEQNISDMIAELTATSGLPGEKVAFQAEQEKAAGLEAMRATEADYTAQLTQLQAEYKNVENRMQLAAEGRGITKAGLAPITMAEQRKLSIQANTVGALLAATQGKITYAQSQVDRAVEAKFGQAEADRAAKIENLNLLLNDPALTREQTNRANAQKAKLEAEAEVEATKKANTKTVMDWATKASANGATPEQAQAIMDIALSDDPDLEKAFELFAPFSAKEEKPTGDVATFKQFFPDVDVTTSEGQQQYLNWKARVGEAGRAPKEIELQPSEGFFDPKIERSIREDFATLSEDFATPANPTEDEQQEAYRQLRSLYSPQEATDEALKNIVGIVPKEEAPTEPATEDVADSWLSDFVSIFAPEKPEVETTKFGTGQFADKNIDDRIAQLKESLGKLATDKYLEEQLLKDGYTPEAIKKKTRTKFLGIF